MDLGVSSQGEAADLLGVIPCNYFLYVLGIDGGGCASPRVGYVYKR